MEVVVDTPSRCYLPNLIYAYPMQNFTFDILHGKIQQVNADLYISPEGDNSNSGLSEDDPFKNNLSRVFNNSGRQHEPKHHPFA